MRFSRNFSILLAVGAFFLIVANIVFSGFGAKKVDSNKTSDFACSTSNFTGLLDTQNTLAVYNGKKFSVPEEVLADKGSSDTKVLGVANEEKWIEVDLSEQKLYAWEGDQLYLETPVSTGLSWWPTPTGEFRIWVKLKYANMEGGEGAYYYNLPNVPYVMYFTNDQVPEWRGYGLHGTYWHNDFGHPHSHGCVNLPTSVAEKLYYWTTPTLPSGKSLVYASDNNKGTRIVIHE